MADDIFRANSDSVISSSRRPFTITPSDSVELAFIPKAIFVGTGGNITLRGVDGTADVVFTNVANGSLLHVRAQFIRATGTTASAMVALA